ncbi:hypothetical protein SCANM63S_03905 [Streptomyces canarius]
MTSYRNGSSGDHKRAFGTGTENSVPTVPVALATGVPPPETVTSTPVPVAPAARTVTRRVLSSRCGTRSRRVMCAAAVGSSQTVCQMPDEAV